MSKSSLPARPPSNLAGPHPPSNPASQPGSSRPSSFGNFRPRQVAGTSAVPSWQAAPAISAAAMSYPSVSPATTTGPSYPPSAYPQPAPSWQQSAPGASSQTPSNLHNPFQPLSQYPQSLAGYQPSAQVSADAEYAQQVAQWQSAYASPADQDSLYSKKGGFTTRGRNETAGNANLTPLGARSETSGTAAGTTAPPSHSQPPAPQQGKTVLRSGGGQQWTDSTLLEWDPSHLRMFVGNLAGEVTDDSLLKAFLKYPSVQKARVVRDKRTTKSKGFGFVSFSDGDDFFAAAKEMQGKYIGSHPVLVKRATTEVRAVDVPGKGGKGKKGGAGGGVKNGVLGPTEGAGVGKKLPKTKGGLKLLG